jgi:hypothetical protein
MPSSRAAALLPLAVALTACAHAGPARAPAPSGVTLALDAGERGEVIFQVPAGWKATRGEPEPAGTGSIRFEPAVGHVVLVVTPLWGPGQSSEPLPPGVAEALVEAERDRAVEGAVEAQLTLRPLEAPGLPGWYFAATDRELAGSRQPPGPDQYRCLVQGAAVAGPLLLAFTLLDDGEGPQRSAALALVRGASHRPASGDPPGAPARRGHGDPSTWVVLGAEPLELELPGRAWSLLLDLPGWRVAEPMARADGSGVSIIGQREADGLLLSASLAASLGRRSAEACRDADWSRIRELDGVGEARLEAGAGEARAWYSWRSDGPPTRHLSAWRYRDGSCLHLHLSLPAERPGVDARLEEALGVARFGEAL